MNLETFPKCNDKRRCCFKNKGKCTILQAAYRKDGDCNFAKANKEDLSYNHKRRKAAFL